MRSIGAFVNIGIGAKALLPSNLITQVAIDNIRDVLQEGDLLRVRVWQRHACKCRCKCMLCIV